MLSIHSGNLLQTDFVNKVNMVHTYFLSVPFTAFMSLHSREDQRKGKRNPKKAASPIQGNDDVTKSR